MQDIIRQIKNMIDAEKCLDMTTEREHYIAGLSDALNVIEDSVANNLIIGRQYFVIMYRDGNIYLPYIEKMKLYKISQRKVKCSYCFTRNLDDSKYATNTPDLVLASKKGLLQRIFFTEEQAKAAIEH